MKKVFTYLILTLIFFCLFLTACNHSLCINKAKDASEEEYIKRYEAEKNITILDKYYIKDKIILLYQEENKYVVDYCSKDDEKKTIKNISKYSWQKDVDEAVSVKCFGTDKDDFVIIVFQNEDIFSRTDKLIVKIEEITLKCDINDLKKEMIIKMPGRPVKYSDISVVLYDKNGNTIKY